MSTKPTAYTGHDPYIFVSYAHKDGAEVLPIITALQERYNVWFDEGIRFGKEWDDEIAFKLEDCHVFLYVISEASLASANCKDEIAFARDRGKPFVNVVLRSDIRFPRAFELRYGRYQMCFVDKFATIDAAVAALAERCSELEATRRAATAQPADTTHITGQTPEEQNEIGERYYDGLYVTQNYEEAARWFAKAARQGYAPAQFNLGTCYDNGQGVPQDSAEAVRWYKLAADQGHVGAQCTMGWCYHKGIGVPQDWNEAAHWYTLAAQNRNAWAQFFLGWCYEKGRGVPQDWNEAIHWYTLAGEQGLAEAQCTLGVCYQNGYGVTKDVAESARWYAMAAEQGHADAQCILGWCYHYGNGVPQDDVQAVALFQEAAKQGLGGGMRALASCYENGWGVKRSRTEAAKWRAMADKAPR